MHLTATGYDAIKLPSSLVRPAAGGTNLGHALSLNNVGSAIGNATGLSKIIPGALDRLTGAFLPPARKARPC